MRNNVRLELECLDQRLLPSVTATFTPGNLVAHTSIQAIVIQNKTDHVPLTVVDTYVEPVSFSYAWK